MGYSRPEMQTPTREWDERMRELHEFLVNGVLPEGVEVADWKPLSPRQAESVIWFLQEITEVLPDTFELCHDCKELVNTYSEGHCVEEEGYYCDDCPR